MKKYLRDKHKSKCSGEAQRQLKSNGNTKQVWSW